MKIQAVISAFILSTLLTSCAQNQNAPSLGGGMRPTQAAAYPGDYQASDMMSSSNMVAPQRPN